MASLALGDVLVAAHLFEPVADLAFGLAGLDDLEPVAAGALVRRARDDLNNFARNDLMVDGHDAVVHLAGDHPVAHGGVDRIGKIDAGGPRRQVDDVALGRKGKHLLGQQVALEVAQQVAGIVRHALVFQQLAHPCEARVQLILPAGQALLVFPVGGDAVLGHLVHLARADLHLKGDALVADDRRVQALVAVGLRRGDIVLEAVGQRMIQVVDQAEGRIALGHRVQHDAHRVHIVDLVERLVLHVHLAVNAVHALDAALHGRVADAALLEALFDHAGHARQELLARVLVLSRRVISS
jgi:hypothetical protein